MQVRRAVSVALLAPLVFGAGCRTLHESAPDASADLADSGVCTVLDGRAAALLPELEAAANALAALDRAHDLGPVNEGLALGDTAPTATPPVAPSCQRSDAAIQVEIELGQRLRELDALYDRLTKNKIAVKFLVNDFYKVIIPDAPANTAQLQPTFVADAKQVERFRAKILLSMIGMEYYPVGEVGAKCSYLGEPRFGAIETSHLQIDPQMRRMSMIVWTLLRRKKPREPALSSTGLKIGTGCGLGFIGDRDAGAVRGVARNTVDRCAPELTAEELLQSLARPSLSLYGGPDDAWIQSVFPEGLHPNVLDEVTQLNAAMLGLYIKYVEGVWPADKGEPLASFANGGSRKLFSVDLNAVCNKPLKPTPGSRAAICYSVTDAAGPEKLGAPETATLQQVATEIEAAFNVANPGAQMKQLEDLLEHEIWALGYRLEYARLIKVEADLTTRALARRVALRRVLGLMREGYIDDGGKASAGCPAR